MKNNQCKKISIFITINLFFWMSLISPTNAVIITSDDILYVGGSGPSNYTIIQDAVNDANPGDMVFVCNGTYYENIVITKTIKLIGEDKNNTIVDGKQKGSVVCIIGIGVILSGFTLQNSSREYYTHAGVEMYSDSNHIENNIIKNNRVGVHVLYARGLIPKGNNTLKNNILTDNDNDAFCVHCSNNIIQRNHMENNGGGVFLQQFARHNKIDENNFINNTHSCGHFRAAFNSWNNNYWDDWTGLEHQMLRFLPKMIPKYHFITKTDYIKLPWPSFDFHPESEPYDIC